MPPRFSKINEFKELAHFFEDLCSRPSLLRFIRVRPLVQTWGTPIEVRAVMPKVLGVLRNDKRQVGHPYMQMALSLLGHIAVEFADAELGQKTIDLVLVKSANVETYRDVLEVFMLIIGASAAVESRTDRLKILALSFERLGYALRNPSALSQCLTLIQDFQQLGSDIKSALSKAASIASLGASRIRKKDLR